MGHNSGGLISQVESLHSRCRGSSPEDEIVTWLQYPLDYTHERGYCSELFEKLASSLGKAELDSDQGVPVSMENPGRRNLSAASENARDALALGAGRASGTALPKGAEIFNKVKTIMQQASCLQPDSSQHKSSSVEKRYENCEPFPISSQFRGLSNTALVADEYPSCGALHNFPTNCMWSSVSPIFPTQGMERLQLSKDSAADSAPCESACLINSKGIEKGSDGQAHIDYTQGSSYSLITEDHRRDASKHAASTVIHWETVGNAMYDAGTPVRLAPHCKEKEWQETCGSMPDVFVPSCSGGSQTSAELSAKETSSLGKKAVDDHDCQSKNAEVDSAEISRPHRRRSKRRRVAESHNLSEKRRRNRINEKLKTLQELIPNSSKTDKASILDEAIEYLKTLQLQLQMMSSRSGMKVSRMSFPLEMQHIQMAHSSVGLGFPLVHTGMGMGSMELQHGIDGRAFQALSAASPYLNLAYSRPAPAPAPSQPYLAMEASSCGLWPLQQPPAQAYHQVYVEPQTVTSSEQGEQLSTPRLWKGR